MTEDMEPAEIEPPTHCPACGHKIGPGRIQFNKNLAKLFLKVCRVASVMKDDAFSVAALKATNDAVGYTIVAKLKYFGIVEQRFEERRSGIYHVTASGWDFLAGITEVALWVDVEKQQVVERSPISVSLMTAMADDWFSQQDWILTWRQANQRRDPQMSLL